jgi:biopolymer transport protein ExbB
VPTPSQKKIDRVLDALARGDFDEAKAKVRDIRGPTGSMLEAGVKYVRETRALVEEVMFEKILETRLRLQSYLPFVAIIAAAAPLMGLLGTVVGIINTFKMITLFGTGDPKTLSAGISEALITTEFGLIVAIPSLLLHAYLSRKARNLVDGMEKTAVGFANRLSTRAVARESA